MDLVYIFFQFCSKNVQRELIFSCSAAAIVHISLAMSAAVLYSSLIPMQYKENKIDVGR